MEPRKQATGESPDAAKKAAIIDALRAFVRQRPGLEFANYGDLASYRAESRRIAMDKRHAETLLSAVAENDGITADMIVKASESAFSGRLTIREREWHQFKPEDCPGKPCSKDCDHRQFRGYAVNYCTGQYFPTEYRRAVCAVLASALWYYVREHGMPSPCAPDGSFRENTSREHYPFKGGRGPVMVRDHAILPAGDWLRAYFRREFGRTIAGRCFL